MNTQEPALQRKSDTDIDAATTASVTQRVANSAHDTIDSAAVKAEELEANLRAGAAKAGKKLEDSQEATTEQIDKSLIKFESFVKGRPFAAAGIAFAAGVLATALLRR